MNAIAVNAELLELEIKALRLQNQALRDEIHILKRYRMLVERASEIVKVMPSAVGVGA